MKAFAVFAMLFTVVTYAHLAQAGSVHYNITLTFIDDTTFTGSFDYDAASQQISNLQGTLDDVLMGNLEVLNYQLFSSSDGKGGITSRVYQLNTTAIGTNPPVNNNVGVEINFNASNPTLGATSPGQLSYMDCSPQALMGNTCMYYLSWHNPVVPMAGGHGVLSEVITSRTDCLFGWAERNYPQLFSPAGTTSQTSGLYYYRYYHYTNSYIGVSSANSDVYYLGPNGKLQDVGRLSDWLVTSGC